MIKEDFLVINIICFLTAIIYVGATGLVNEFNIEDSNNATETNETEHHNLTKPDMSPKIINKKQRTSNETKTKDDLAENGTLLHDSMYTDSDLEETKSTNNELDGPDTKEKEANHTREKHKRKEEMSSVYTESDLEATASQDEKKHGGNQEKDKKSTESYLVVLHKRDINDAEQEDGSGEGSGQEPLTNYTN